MALGPYGPLHGQVWRGTDDLVPILLLHDSLGCVTLWRDFPAQLAKATGRNVVAYDRAGFGQSVVRTAQVSPSFIADEAFEGVVPVLDALGINKVVLLGHSVGGGMAVAAGAALSERVVGVITISAQAFVEDLTLAGVRDAKVAFAQDGQVERLARYHGERARWILDAWIETWLHPDYAGWSLSPMLEKLSVPVLALHGDQDEFGSAKHPQMIANQSLGEGRMRIFEGVGHMPHKEVPDALLGEVNQYLASLKA